MGDAGEKNFRVVFALGLSVCILGFVFWERKACLSFSRFLLFIGNASYAIYLVHNPLLSVTQRFAGQLDMNWVGALLCGVLMSVLAGCAYHIVVEKPTIRFFQRQFSK